MNNEIGYVHHVGHVVRDMETARDLYRKLGFLCSVPAYPTLSRNAGELAKPFGAASMHASFARNFVEIMVVVTEESHLADDAHPIPLQVWPAALPRVVESVERTIAKISASLARFEGLHILVFQTEDAHETARRFDQTGVGHSGVNTVQQLGQQVPMGVIEIDKEDVPEGRLAVAEPPVSEVLLAQPSLQHSNGAVDLVESILCTPDTEVEAYVERYQRYLGRAARSDGAAYPSVGWESYCQAKQHECSLRLSAMPSLCVILAQHGGCLRATGWSFSTRRPVTSLSQRKPRWVLPSYSVRWSRRAEQII